MTIESNDILTRSKSIFFEDLINLEKDISELISGSKILVIGAAGTIGQSVFYELFKRKPKIIHAVDISENNLVELVRNIRSSSVDQNPELKTFAIDIGSEEFKNYASTYKDFDYIFNLSALKHVRSEKDEFTLMRLINVNIFNTIELPRLFSQRSLKNYFVVSTDKATNPVNMMGASKRIMEKFLFQESNKIKVSLARFANVTFSDGSLLYGFNQRILKNQPIAAPKDIKRYFITQKESGELCLISGFLGKNRDIFFPKLSNELKLINFEEITRNFLTNLGYEPYECQTEEEARDLSKSLIGRNKWPCFFFESDTTGEKDFEEFYSEKSNLNLSLFKTIGVIKNELPARDDKLDEFSSKVKKLYASGEWSRKNLIDSFNELLDEFSHVEKGRFLDEKM